MDKISSGKVDFIGWKFNGSFVCGGEFYLLDGDFDDDDGL